MALVKEIQKGASWPWWETLHEQGEFRLERCTDFWADIGKDRKYRIVQLSRSIWPNTIRAAAAILEEIKRDWEKIVGVDCPYTGVV
jgi:hypothetical protein